MVKVPFSTADFSRRVTGAANLLLKNRYFEENPSLSDDGAALVARPGMRRLVDIGDGPIRGIASEAGSFSGDLFVASGAAFYRMDKSLNKTLIYSNLYAPETGSVSMAITGAIGTTPEFNFIADGSSLYVYMANGYARNTLSGSPANNDVVVIDTVYYKWTTGSVNAGTPAGTNANPWLVAKGGTDLLSFQNLYYAINVSGTAGTNYSTATTAHPSVLSDNYGASEISVRALINGAGGNTIVSTETGASIAWSHAATFSQGGDPTFTSVLVPDDQGVIDVAVINSYVIVIPVQDNGYQGRFYWINPGETAINPLNYATAERSPDALYGVQVFGDQFWLPGESTTEVWYMTGDPTAPATRLQGVVLDRGSWSNTSKAIHESMVIVDADGGVFLVKGGSPQRVSTPNLEEQIRRAISLQQSYLY